MLPSPTVLPPTLPYDVTHLLDGAALLLSFMMLAGRRIGRLVNAYAAQAAILALAAAWQGWVQASPGLYATALFALLAKGIAIPVVLRGLVRRLGLRRNEDAAPGVFTALMLGVALTTLAMVAVLPAVPAAEALTREDLALALSVVLLGLLMTITRRSALTQTIGFLSMANGLGLAAVGVPGIPVVVECAVAALVVMSSAVLGVFVVRIQRQFSSLDLSHLDQVGISHR